VPERHDARTHARTQGSTNSPRVQEMTALSTTYLWWQLPHCQKYLSTFTHLTS
jgi:hypothetical protein